jgi:hypothetical protein
MCSNLVLLTHPARLGEIAAVTAFPEIMKFKLRDLSGAIGKRQELIMAGSGSDIARDRA